MAKAKTKKSADNKQDNKQDKKQQKIDKEHEEEIDLKLRPFLIKDMIGQETLKANYENLVLGAKKQHKVIRHTLLDGPAGTGKTTLARALANEMETEFYEIYGGIVKKEDQITALLRTLKRGDILFIDEVHLLKLAFRGLLYHPMEDFKFEYEDKDGNLRSQKMPQFTLVVATTRKDKLERPFLDRFKNQSRTVDYSMDEMIQIVARSSKILGWKVSEDAIKEIASRSKYKPRYANNILDRSIIYAETIDAKEINLAIAIKGAELLGFKKKGLQEIDLKYIKYLADRGGGPVGLDDIAGYMEEDTKRVETDIESYLFREKFITKSSKGRRLAKVAIDYLGLKLTDLERLKMESTGTRYTTEVTTSDSGVSAAADAFAWKEKIKAEKEKAAKEKAEKDKK